MYNLSLHIEYLLLHHDCVVLPGVGAFINVRHAARFDEGAGTWLPMAREVRFNSVLTHDDGLLATSYARKNRLDFQDGRELLRQDLERLRESLKSDGEVTIGNLGILCQAEETLVYKPLYPAQKWASLLGRQAAPSGILSKSKKPEILNIEVQPAKIKPDEEISDESKREEAVLSAEALHKSSVTKTDRLNFKRNYYVPVNKMFARSVACLCLVIAVFVSFYIPTSERHRIDQASVIPVDEMIRESVENRKQIFMNPVEESADLTESNDTDSQNVVKGKTYYAIVGTFMTRREAEQYVNSIGSTPYSLSLVETPTRVRVAAIGSDDRDSLLEQMRTPKFRSAFPQAWIWNREEQ